MGELMAKCGVSGKVGFSKAMSNGWIMIDKADGGKVKRKVVDIRDTVKDNLNHVNEGKADAVEEKVKAELKKRKLLEEIFAFHPGLNKWVEIGNSGMFRPEMLLPMGLPEDVRVIAWGLSLERPTMIKYGIDNIRDLVGHKVDLDMVQKNPLCRI